VYWERVHEQKEPEQVSWYAPQLEHSVALWERTGLGAQARVVDVGGGISTFADAMIERGVAQLAVVDISAAALERTKRRLAQRAESVRFVVADVTEALDLEQIGAPVGLWHDRAVFHFLTQPEQRDAYRDNLSRALAPGGYVIAATFALDGPSKCSGLEVARYDAASLVEALSDSGRGLAFEVLEHREVAHTTPWGSEQRFVYVLLRRREAIQKM
jgi:SAM-dependent methyltransferase